VKILERAVNEEKRQLKLMRENGYDDTDGGEDLKKPSFAKRVAGDSLTGVSVSPHDIEFDKTPAAAAAPSLQKRAEEVPEPTEAVIDIAVDAFIPQRYIESEILRIEIYKRIAAIENKDDADDLKDELLDRFGDIPKPVENLTDIALIRNSARLEYIDSIENRDKSSVLLYSNMLADRENRKILEKWTVAAAKLNGRLLLSMGQKPHAAYFLKDGENVIGCLKEILSVLGGIVV
jgi:hypothetical protein